MVRCLRTSASSNGCASDVRRLWREQDDGEAQAGSTVGRAAQLASGRSAISGRSCRGIAARSVGTRSAQGLDGSTGGSPRENEHDENPVSLGRHGALTLEKETFMEAKKKSKTIVLIH